MKKIFFVFIALAFSSCSTKEYQYFGMEIEDKVTHSYAAVFDLAQNGVVENVILDGVITQTCAKKGCWMDVKMAEGDTMMVRFKDYGFFVPMDSTGEIATVEGAMTIDTLDVDWLRHQASDAGKSDSVIASINTFEVSYSILATGVALEKKIRNEESIQLED